MPGLSVHVYVRLATAAALLSLTFKLGGLAPLFSGAPVLLPSGGGNTPVFPVNRFRKGDRLPLFDASGAKPTAWRPKPRGPVPLETTEKMPLGCDPAFSPVAPSSRIMVYGRCMV